MKTAVYSVSSLLCRYDDRERRFYGSCLTGADLKGVNLAQAGLSESNLDGANLQNAILTQTYLVSSSLKEAILIGADLTNADLGESDLTNANLTGANLTGVSLWKTNLIGANLTNANLTGANLTAANLACVKLSGVKGIATKKQEMETCSKILNILDSGEGILDMTMWESHSPDCQNTHTLDGWVNPYEFTKPEVRASTLCPTLARYFLVPTNKEAMQALRRIASGEESIWDKHSIR